jgi:hypothetical protein
MIKIEKDRDGATLTFRNKKYSYLWNEYTQDDFKKMLIDIRDLLGVPVEIFIGKQIDGEDTWND